MDLNGRYYNPRPGASADMKGLVKALDILIARLPRPDTPERPRRKIPRESIHQLRSEQIEAIVRDYAAGMTMLQIGERYNINRQTVSKALRREGVVLRR